MIKVVSLASIILFSSVALAGNASNTVQSNQTWKGGLVGSKGAAIAESRSMIMKLNEKSSYELSRAVRYSRAQEVDVNSFELKNSSAMIEEIVTNDGSIAYQPVINMSVEYKARDRR